MIWKLIEAFNALVRWTLIVALVLFDLAVIYFFIDFMFGPAVQ